MTKQTIRDYNNKLLGYVDEKPDGWKSIRDPMNREIGRYDPNNKFTTVKGRPVAKGDLSLGLLGGQLIKCIH